MSPIAGDLHGRRSFPIGTARLRLAACIAAHEQDVGINPIAAMKVFDDKHIKNVALVGAQGSGKTTLAETMLFEAGLLPRRGRVEDRNTVSDHHPLEQERMSSAYSTVLHTEWRNYKINIIDTPGADELVGETVPALRVADTCVLLVHAQHGVEVGTELAWQRMARYGRPVIIGINQLDHPHADMEGTTEQLRERFGNGVVLMQYPVEQGEGFHRIIDLLKMTMYVFKDAGGKPEKQPIPPDERERAQALHKELVEKAAENDERLMEHYFEHGELDEDEMRQGLKLGMMRRTCFPVFCLSAERNMGSGRLMGFIDNVAPGALEMPAEELLEGGRLEYRTDGPPVLFVFKTELDPRGGNLTLFKVMSGQVAEGMELRNDRTGAMERLNQLYIVDGRERHAVPRLMAGDIGATVRLKDTATADTLHAPASELALLPLEFPPPRLLQAIRAEDERHEERLHNALIELQKEDPTVELRYLRETAEQVVGLQGELHLALLKWKLEHLHKTPSVFRSPRIPYRETIRRAAEGSHRHKKQTGGSGQFGEVHLSVEPWYEGMAEPAGANVRGREEVHLPTGGRLLFYNCVVGGAIDNKFIPSILKGVMEKMEKGPLTGSPARDIRVIVHDGKMHAVDSNDLSFKIAGLMAFKEAFTSADPLLLEPVQELEVRVPEEFAGEVMTDLQGRRSTILGILMEGQEQVIRAHTPLAELDRYSTKLRSITRGRGMHTERFHGYQQVPADMQRRLVQEHAGEALAR